MKVPSASTMPKRSASPSVAMPIAGADLLHLLFAVAEQVVVGLGRVAAEEDVAIVVDGFDGDAGIAQEVGAVAAARAPEGIVDDLDAGLGDGLEVDKLGEAAEEGGFDVGGFESAGGWSLDWRGAGLERGDGRFDLFGHFGKRRGAVVGGELDAVVLGRIVRGGEVDGAGGLEGAHGIGDGRGGRGIGNHDGSDAGAGKDSGGDVDEGFAEEARIAADQDAVRLGLRLYVGGNAGDGEADVGHGKFVGHNGPPAGGAKFDHGTHRSFSSSGCDPAKLWI